MCKWKKIKWLTRATANCGMERGNFLRCDFIGIHPAHLSSPFSHSFGLIKHCSIVNSSFIQSYFEKVPFRFFFCMGESVGSVRPSAGQIRCQFFRPLIFLSVRRVSKHHVTFFSLIQCPSDKRLSWEVDWRIIGKINAKYPTVPRFDLDGVECIFFSFLLSLISNGIRLFWKGRAYLKWKT